VHYKLKSPKKMNSRYLSLLTQMNENYIYIASINATASWNHAENFSKHHVSRGRLHIILLHENRK